MINLWFIRLGGIDQNWNFIAWEKNEIFTIYIIINIQDKFYRSQSFVNFISNAILELICICIN